MKQEQEEEGCRSKSKREGNLNGCLYTVGERTVRWPDGQAGGARRLQAEPSGQPALTTQTSNVRWSPLHLSFSLSRTVRPLLSCQRETNCSLPARPPGRTRAAAGYIERLSIDRPANSDILSCQYEESTSRDRLRTGRAAGPANVLLWDEDVGDPSYAPKHSLYHFSTRIGHPTLPPRTARSTAIAEQPCLPLPVRLSRRTPVARPHRPARRRRRACASEPAARPRGTCPTRP